MARRIISLRKGIFEGGFLGERIWNMTPNRLDVELDIRSATASRFGKDVDRVFQLYL